MGKRTTYEPGTFCWVELTTSDPAAAKAFYGGLFGWEAEDMPVGDGMVYTMLRLDGDDVAALYRTFTEGTPPSWMSHVSVESADATASRARELAATVISEPFDVLDSGRMTVLQDPAGAVLAAWEPRRHVGAGRVNEAGCWCWNELTTPDVTAAVKDFYSGVFEWAIERRATPEGAPTIFGIENRVGWRNGNVRETTDQPPAWTPYFAVESCRDALARVEELGGRALFGPLEVPSGRLGVATDPQGAVFGLVDGQLDP